MAATDARPVPKKGVAYRHYFAIRKTDGTLITTWAGQDSEVSKDGGDYADATNEATEIQTSGTGYIDLTSTEMNADVVLLKVTVTNTGAQAYVCVLYPEEAGDIRADSVQLGGQTVTAAAGITIRSDVGAAAAPGSVNGMLIGGSNAATTFATLTSTGAFTCGSTVLGNTTMGTLTQTGAVSWGATTFASVTVTNNLAVGGTWTVTGATTLMGQITATNASNDIKGIFVATNGIAAASIATGAITNAKFANGAIDAAAIANGAIDAATFAADVDAEILSYLVDDATRIDASALNTAAGTSIPAILADTNELQTDWANGGRLDLILDARASQTSVDTIDGIVDAILVDTGTTLDSLIKDIPTVAEFEARSVVAADYFVVTDYTVPPTAGAIADAVWDELLSGHTGAGSAGSAMAAASSGGVDPAVLADAIWDEALSGHATAGTAGKKLTDLANADLSGVATAAELAKVPKSDSNVTWNSTALASINAEVDAALNTAIPGSPTANSINERIATMDGRILGTLAAGTHNPQTGDAYEYLTTNLGLLGANATALASATNLATVAGYLDTEIATILGYVDCLPAILDGSTFTALGDTRIANLNATVSSRSSHSASDVAALVLVSPTNKLATDASGHVTFNNSSVAVSDKTGFSLSATGLDAIASPDDLTPGVVPSTFTQWFRWLILRFIRADKSVSAITVKNTAGQVITTQPITSSGDNETLGAPS